MVPGDCHGPEGPRNDTVILARLRRLQQSEKIKLSFSIRQFNLLGNSFKLGSIVTIIAKPASGCDVDTVAVTDANNVSIPVFNNNDNYVFTMPDSDVTVNVTFKENPISEPSVNKDSTSNETVADDYNITVEESENGNVTTEVISKEESSADVSVDDNTTVNSESITTDSQNSDFESSADSTIPVTSPSDVDSDANPQEEASNDNILLWVLPAILLILIAALVVLLIVRKKRLEHNYN